MNFLAWLVWVSDSGCVSTKPEVSSNSFKRGYAPGRVPILSEEQQDRLRKELQNPQGFHSYVQIQEYIADTFGKVVQTMWLIGISSGYEIFLSC